MYLPASGIRLLEKGPPHLSVHTRCFGRLLSVRGGREVCACVLVGEKDGRRVEHAKGLHTLNRPSRSAR